MHRPEESAWAPFDLISGGGLVKVTQMLPKNGTERRGLQK